MTSAGDKVQKTAYDNPSDILMRVDQLASYSRQTEYAQGFLTRKKLKVTIPFPILGS